VEIISPSHVYVEKKIFNPDGWIRCSIVLFDVYGFKPVNIEPYDGTTDPAVWIEDFLLHIHMARGDDLHAIKYLPLKLKGPS